jgi:hypothetical protein
MNRIEPHSTIRAARRSTHFFVAATFVAATFVAASALTSTARAAVINFGSLSQPGAGFNNVGGVLVQDGFQFTSSLSTLGTWQNSSPNHPVGGAPATSLMEFFAGGQTTMTKVGGGTFDLYGIDLAGYSTAGAGPFNVTFTGTKSDSSIVQQTFSPLNANGLTPSLQSFNFNNFTDVVSVGFTQGINATNAYQFNNIAVNQGTPASGFLGPSPYLSFADSPFNSAGLQNFYLEDFEDGLLNTAGVSASVVGGTLDIYPSGFEFTDSVDADDGLLDGNGNGGTTLGVGSAEDPASPSTVTFSFDAGVLGHLPTHVGIAWTDVGFSTSPQGYGFGTVTFEAFDEFGVSLGMSGPYLLGDGDSAGQTAEDRFFGIINLGGVSKITLASNSHDWEMDHLQYGMVPEPSTWTLFGLGIAVLLGTGWRVPARRGGKGVTKEDKIEGHVRDQ